MRKEQKVVWDAWESNILVISMKEYKEVLGVPSGLRFQHIYDHMYEIGITPDEFVFDKHKFDKHDAMRYTTHIEFRFASPTILAFAKIKLAKK